MLLLLLSGCDTAPEITNNLPREVATFNAEFSKRLQTKFPEGTPAKTLLDYLKKDGFDLIGGQQRAVHAKSSLVCNSVYTVFWTTKPKGENFFSEDIIETIHGYWTLVCL
jgi:hypothetical protein